MAKRFRLHTFHLLFRLFSYLADRSGGWSIFVKPKLVIGSLIVGFTFSISELTLAQTTKRKVRATYHTNKSKTKNQKTDSIKYSTDDQPTVSCYIMDDHESFTLIDDMPEFPGGNNEMSKFITKNMIYPSSGINSKIEGLVICSFNVNIDGTISDIIVLRGINSALDSEAVRVIKSFPKWIPGKQGGKVVPVKYTLPIRFTLPNK